MTEGRNETVPYLGSWNPKSTKKNTGEERKWRRRTRTCAPSTGRWTRWAATGSAWPSSSARCLRLCFGTDTKTHTHKKKPKQTHRHAHRVRENEWASQWHRRTANTKRNTTSSSKKMGGRSQEKRATIAQKWVFFSFFFVYRRQKPVPTRRDHTFQNER